MNGCETEARSGLGGLWLGDLVGTACEASVPPRKQTNFTDHGVQLMSSNGPSERTTFLKKILFIYF